MCEKILKQISSRNFPAVGTSDDSAFFVGKTSLQYVNPFAFRFAPATVKMSKDATVTVLGAFQFAENEFGITGDYTNRRGLHIYLRRACTSSVGKGFEDWSHAQSIIRDLDNKLLQVNEAAVSANGHSIITLSHGQKNIFGPPTTGPQIYVFERESNCHEPNKQALWHIQQTMLQEPSLNGAHWNLISANDDQTILVVQSTVDNHFEIYKRERTQKTKFTIDDSDDGYQFKLAQKIFPADLASTSLSFGRVSALSHDGETLMITANLSADSFLYLVQMQYDCKENKYVMASTIPCAVRDELLFDLKFGGACSERLFLLYENDGIFVKVFSRVAKDALSCCSSASLLKSQCCSSQKLINFSQKTLVDTLKIVFESLDGSFKYSLLTEAVNGDFFIVLAALENSNLLNIVSAPVPKTLFSLAYRQKGCTKEINNWSSCDINDYLPDAEFYTANAYDMLSFDKRCQRFYFPLRQQILPVSFPPSREFAEEASLVFVSNPDGCFYLTRYDPLFYDPEAKQIYWYYYRVTGSNEPFVLGNTDAQLNEIANATAYAGSLININANTCASKYLDVKIVDATLHPVAPTPLDLLVNPMLVYYTLKIPMRLCFSVLGFRKS